MPNSKSNRALVVAAAPHRHAPASSRALVACRPEFRTALLRWYREQARPLPWRASPTVYKTVVSEFMLQQTQVKTVLPYFSRWLAELPDFASLAGADEARVLRLWEGLGYYSRARNLHRLARAIHVRPELPRTAAGWCELPGVGPYTAAAIASIAFNEPAACIDGNVVRLLARLTRDRTQFSDSASAARHFIPLAAALLCPASPGDHNQAMMELGATVCLRQNPRCPTCPVRRFCAAARHGGAESLPRLAPKRVEQRSVVRVWCERGGKLLLHCAPAVARRLAGIHELPTAAQAGLDETQARRGELLVRKRRTITRYQITESIHHAPAPRRQAASGLTWVPLAGLDGIPLSGPHRRWVGEILARRQSAPGSHQGFKPLRAVA